MSRDANCWGLIYPPKAKSIFTHSSATAAKPEEDSSTLETPVHGARAPPLLQHRLARHRGPLTAPPPSPSNGFTNCTGLPATGTGSLAVHERRPQEQGCAQGKTC